MYNTGNAVPSDKLEDMADNAQVFDSLVTQTEGTTTDRLGVTRRVFQQIIMDMGFQPLTGSFQAGDTITARNQCLQDTSTGVFYSWNGALPKVVPAGSTPATAGGVGTLLWVDRTDIILRANLAAADGEKLIGQCPDIATLRTLSPTVGQRVKVKAAVGVISGDFYCSSDTSSTDNGYTVIAAANGYRWKRKGLLNTDDLGCHYDGVTDDSVLINAALAQGLSVELLPNRGVMAFASELLLAVDKAVIYSRGPVFAKKTAVHNVIKITANDCIVDCRYLYINGNSFGGSGNLVTGARNRIKGVVSYSNGDHGFCVDGQSTDASFNVHEDCWAYSNGQVGFAANSAPDYTRKGCRSKQNNYEGLTVDLTSYRSKVIDYRSFQDCQTGGVGGIGIDQASQSQFSDIHIQNTGSSLPAIRCQNNIASTNYCTFSNLTLLDNAGGGLYFYKNTTTGFTSNYNTVSGLTCQNNTGFDIKIDDGCVGNVLSSIAANATIIDLNTSPKNSAQGGLKSAFRAYNNTLRSNVTGDGTSYVIPFDAENFDANGDHSAGVFTVPKTGIYQLTAGVRLQGGSGGTWARLNLVQTRDGSTIQTSAGEIDSAAIGTYQPQVSDIFYLVKGDSVSCNIVVGGGTKTYSIPADSGLNYFSGVFLQ